MKKLGLLRLSVVSFAALTAFGEKHSQVETKTSVVGSNLEIEVKVQPDADMVISKDAPWQIAFTQAPGLKLELKDGKYVSKTFDEKLPGFRITAPLDGQAKAGRIDYEVKAFVCTSDKKQCFPQQHKGSIDWKRS